MMKRILNISSEIEAQRIKEILDSNGISHIIRSFHDSAYDGLFQNQLGWGVLEADDSDEKLILDLVGNDIIQPLDNEDEDTPQLS
jgi:hypothetical protein